MKNQTRTYDVGLFRILFSACLVEEAFELSAAYLFLDPFPFDAHCSRSSSTNAKGTSCAINSLHGVLVLSGYNTHSGHLYCYVRSSNNAWYILDDIWVKPASECGVSKSA
ncbi:hypothetical protein KIW84_072352 [Lathyrus oleraceus]|uniref:Peptidase C19 ubiquitin carboxyl-terminal hydrolase domain-containing protein n=1 Tax=Pisum sativum TaxID=3888 RepID=A0A9D4VLX4_PEA|nr:hypothetical protein KIW84_072352 [Pisum sativum]